MLGFAPWLSFLIIAQGSLLRLKIGLIVALALSLVMGVTKLHRGLILWVGLAFFTSAAIAVVGFNNLWVAKHMGILANGALALGTWLTLALKRPFTLDYAKQHTDPSLWQHPVFIRTNVILTSVWGVAFTISTALAWGKINQWGLTELGYELLNYGILIGAVTITNIYPQWLKHHRHSPISHKKS